MKAITHQRLTVERVAREKLRDKGQFWTPDWIAEAMVAYVSKSAEIVFDPGVGKGAFYEALKKIAPEKRFFGTDIDPEIIAEARAEGIFGSDVELEVRDFILDPPRKRFGAIVANPPYIRHHRLSSEYKEHFRKISLQNLGTALDGRAGLHVYFLIKALGMLDRGGRLAFIMPADTCEGVFASKLWNWIAREFRIDGVITFDYKATPFPGVDTNAVIFLIQNDSPLPKLQWARCLESGTEELFQFISRDLKAGDYKSIEIQTRDLDEALATGLSRAPRSRMLPEHTLVDFAYVVRGIATGANEFFFLTKKRAEELGIPDSFLLPAIGRTRDVDSAVVTQETLQRLEAKGRPTQLFSPNAFQRKDMPKPVKRYILEGEKQELPKRALISTRRPWYKMEVRRAPKFLFAYLGRRNARFIKNDAGVIPLTGFLCVYPRSMDGEYIEKLWTILQHPDTIENLKLVGKSYGSGAVKVEPRALERLPLPSALAKGLALKSKQATRPNLF